MARVIALRMVGGAYQRGMYSPGWGQAYLSDGTTLTTCERQSHFDAILEVAEQRGHDTTRMRARLEVWVKTGQMPPE